MSENPSQHVSPVTLEEVREQMRDCRLCRLCEGRNTIVFGDGNPHARVMFIGEGPGKNEDLGGRPFIGAAGKKLDGYLAAAGLSRDDIFITNVVKCRPPSNRNPRPEEIEAYKPKSEAQTKAIEEYMNKQVNKLTSGQVDKLTAEQVNASNSSTGQPVNSFTPLQPYDRFYYSAKMKKDQYSFSDDDVKPYFNLDSVLVNGIFYAAHRVYGLSFRERKDIPTYHKDMKVFDVIDADGKQLALFYCDYFRRPTKRGGAWMSAFLKQSSDRQQKPLIFNVCNYAKAPEGQPTLLTWDETQTMFHEFGHALHGMLSNCKYNTLSGTAVSRDFVEMPSQFNESFASIPEVFNHYARHYKTNEPMPDALREKMLGSLNFLSAYALGENLAATSVDLAWHCLSPSEVPTAEEAPAFEKKVLADMDLLNNQIPPRYSTSYFNHIWGGGYAAGYYSYLWSEVLAANIADYFEAHGALTRKVGDDFRQKILSRGNTRDLMQIFSDFTGLKAPDTKGLLKARGM